MKDDTAAIRHCIRGCARAAGARGPAQLERRLAEKLARTGSERIAAQAAAAARRVGVWIGSFKG